MTFAFKIESEETAEKQICGCGGQLQIQYAQISSAGVKALNEDALGVYPPPQDKHHSIRSTANCQHQGGIVALVADGVSQANHAREASQFCVNDFIRQFKTKQITTPNQLAIQRSLKKINATLFAKNQASNNSEPELWLSTLCGLIIESNSAFLFHVGDSQIIRYRNQSLQKLTSPHQQKMSDGQPLLVRAMGADSHLAVDYNRLEVMVDDLYLLSTDGIHDFIDDSAISNFLRPHSDKEATNHSLSDTCNRIVQTALEKGSTDNLSCIILKIVALPGPNNEELCITASKKVVPPPLQAGNRIDHFKILQTLHQSPRSHLYLVEDESNGKVLSLKTPSLNFEEDELYLKGFLRERWLAKQLQHPNLVKMYEVPTDSKFHYHLCEFIKGQTLTDWIKENPKPGLSTVQNLIAQIVQGLRLLKRHSIVHRDLKPDNILVDQYGVVKIIDLGNVWIEALEELSSLPSQQAPAHSTDGSWYQPEGTIDYAAPEICAGQRPTASADLYSLAVIAYQMLTGMLPFASQPSFSRMTKPTTINRRYRSIKQFRPELPDWLDNVFENALTENPADRYQHYSEFTTDLSKPNTNAVERYRQQPLIEKDPVRFWQLISLLLAITIVLMLLF